MSNEIRQDGYVNLMNKWGTSQDASEGAIRLLEREKALHLE